MIDKINNISPLEAWKILKEELDAQLIDVRSEAEWNSIGIVDLSTLNKSSYNISWRFYPENNINSRFVNLLEENLSNKKTKLLFICKSGGRSLEAAKEASKYGYRDCYNILHGFEGYHMGEHNQPGWKQFNLPWRHLK